jgi:hypothetical protein
MAYTQIPGRGNNPKTGDKLPTGLNSGSTASRLIDPPVKKLSSTNTSTKEGNTTTTNTSYANKTAIGQVKGATGIEFTKEGINSIAQPSNTKNVELNLGKYKDYVTKGSMSTSGPGETTQTYTTVKGRVMNPTHREEIASYVRSKNPGKNVKIADWK